MLKYETFSKQYQIEVFFKTSTSLHYLLYELGTNPNVQEKLYKELKKNLTTDQNIAEEDLTKLRFLKYVIKESLR